MKPNGVTTQMKALDEYILMVPFVLSQKRVIFDEIFVFLDQSGIASEKHILLQNML